MEKIISKIHNSKSIAVLTHINEDPDTLCSCFAFVKAVRAMGKTANIYVSGEIEKRISFIGNDYEIYNPDAQYEHDLCVCIDSGDLSRIGERKKLFYEIGNTINIDHHYSNPCYADENYVDGDASSAGEIIYRLLEQMNVEITKEIATDLYTAICSDTGCFKYSNVSSKTMYTAGKLLEKDINNAEIARLLFDCESLTSVKIKAEATEKMESYYGGKVRCVSMTRDMYERYGVSEADAPNLVDIPRTVEETEIAICFKEQEGKIRISLRSNGACDVSLVAEKFGGGGHKKAAGCTIEGSALDEIKGKVIKECESLI